jgi:prepilin peptidase CpaA
MIFEGNHVTLFIFVVTSAAALVAAVFDFRRFRVPNVLTGFLCVSGMLFHAIAGEGLEYSLVGVVVGFGLLAVFFVIGVMGAGDVKLLAGVGAWIGGGNTLYVFCVAGLLAGAYSLVAITLQGRLRHIPAILQVTFLQLLTLGRHIARSESVTVAAQRPDRRRYVMPFAVMIAIGVVAVAANSATLNPAAAGTVLLAIVVVAAAARGWG